MGRPAKFTGGRREQILELLSAGASRREAARAAGIVPSTLTKWIRRGERSRYPESGYRRFYLAVLEAEAHPSIRALKDEQDRMLGDPDLAWRFIERRYPDYVDRLASSSPTITLKFD
jgi:transposase-like protein